MAFLETHIITNPIRQDDEANLVALAAFIDAQTEDDPIVDISEPDRVLRPVEGVTKEQAGELIYATNSMNGV